MAPAKSSATESTVMTGKLLLRRQRYGVGEDQLLEDRVARCG